MGLSEENHIDNLNQAKLSPTRFRYYFSVKQFNDRVRYAKSGNEEIFRAYTQSSGDIVAATQLAKPRDLAKLQYKDFTPTGEQHLKDTRQLITLDTVKAHDIRDLETAKAYLQTLQLKNE